MSEKIKFGRSPVFFDPFERRPGPIKKNMHYCPGCGHGILHKLVAEAIDHYGIQGKTMFMVPVGCAVFAYYYFNVGAISVPHGRAPAVGTGVARAVPDSYVISYQGDGDLAAIGFNEFLQAANRGEKISIFFVNNSNYGMTGGQMAPTTLPGQKTATTPFGRNVLTDGFPVHVAEMVNCLTAPIYIERVALTSTARIMNAKKAVFKAIENLKERKGFSFVEVLAPCPVNLKMNADQINEFIETQMIPEYPLGCLRDRSAETAPGELPPPPAHDVETVKKVLFPPAVEDDGAARENTSEIFNRELRIKMAGFGGQGILSLGITLANMARLRNFNVSWMPSYGPEQRGGAASCAVIVSRNRIPSPMISRDCDLLIATTQTALDKYVGELKEDGILIYDETAVTLPELPAAMTKVGVDAVGIASRDVGSPKFVNSVLIGVLSVVLEQKGLLTPEDQKDFELAFTAAVREKFGKKPGAVESNAQAFAAGRQGAAGK